MSFFLSFFYRHLFWSPPKPITSFEGKTVIVTGANTGLGKEATRWLVTLGAQVIMAVRNLTKGGAAVADIRSKTRCAPDAIKVWQLDMSSYSSVVTFAERAKTELPHLDALLANAGVHSEKWRMTESNEEHNTTNVISTALISCLLYPKLQETAARSKLDTHISVTSSDLYFVANFKEHLAPEGQLFTNLNDEKKSNIMDRYNVSKLLEIYIIREIAAARPYDSHRVIVNCVPPGFCYSELTRERETFCIRVLKKVLARPTEVGSRTLVHAASATPASHGQYIEDGIKIRETLGHTQGKEGADIQRRFCVELKQILESIRPGATSFKYS